MVESIQRLTLMVESIQSSWPLGLEYRVCHSLAVWLWASHLTSLCLSFFTYKVGVMIIIIQNKWINMWKPLSQYLARGKHYLRVWFTITFIFILLLYSSSQKASDSLTSWPWGCLLFLALICPSDLKPELFPWFWTLPSQPHLDADSPLCIAVSGEAPCPV